MTLASGLTGPLTPAQQRFKDLLAQLHASRTLVHGWRQVSEQLHQAQVQQLVPLQQRLRQSQRGWVLAADQALNDPSLPRAQRQRLQQRLLFRAEAWLADGLDAEVEAAFDRHSSVPHHELRAADIAATAQVLDSVFGVKVAGRGPARTADELLRQAGQQLQAQRQQAEERKQAKRAARAERRAAQADDATRARQLARDEARQAVRDAMSQSVRSVFRKLASALHPDREPDPALRERKTALMQQANAAYEANDLLMLLSLQLETEQIDPGQLAQWPEHRLQHVTAVLQEQLDELEGELHQLLAPMAAALDEPWPEGRSRLSHERVVAWQAEQLQQTRSTLHDAEQALAATASITQLRDWLKSAPADESDRGLDDWLAAAQAWQDDAPTPGRRAGGKRARR